MSVAQKIRKEKSNLMYWLSKSLDGIKHSNNILITLFGVTQAVGKPTCLRYEAVKGLCLQEFFEKYLWPKEKQDANKKQQVHKSKLLQNVVKWQLF